MEHRCWTAGSSQQSQGRVWERVSHARSFRCMHIYGAGTVRGCLCMTPAPRLHVTSMFVFMCAWRRMRGRLTVIDLSHTRPALNTWTIATNTLTPSITAPLEAQRVHVCMHACAFECVCVRRTASLTLLPFNSSTIDCTYKSVMVYLYQAFPVLTLPLSLLSKPV